MSINVHDLAGGAVGERLNIELQKAAQNILDPNTDWKKPRKVTLTITLRADESREIALVDVEAKTTLAPPRAVATKFVIDRDERGQAVAAELKSGVKNQMMMDDDGDLADDRGHKVQAGNVVQFK